MCANFLNIPKIFTDTKIHYLMNVNYSETLEMDTFLRQTC